MSCSNRARVLLLIPHLGGGGAERVIEMLARFLNPKKYEVHLGIVTSSHADLAEEGQLANIHKLNTLRIRHSSLKLLGLVWQIRPDVILSGMAHLNLLVLLLRPALPRRTRVLVRQNGPLSGTLAPGANPRLSRVIYGLAYRRADLVICQSESMKHEIQREFSVDDAKLVVLNNPVDADLIRKTIEVPETTGIALRLIAIGRLVPEKGFDLLLEAFASLSNRFSNASLVIVGSGPRVASLKQQSEMLGIAHRVHFTGYVASPAVFFRGASLFVLSSRTEGIPNALLEAAAAGLPIVATPASVGLTDHVTEKDGVWLADRLSAEGLRIALESALDVITPGQRYPHDWIAPFEIARAIPAFEAVIDRAIGERSN